MIRAICYAGLMLATAAAIVVLFWLLVTDWKAPADVCRRSCNEAGLEYSGSTPGTPGSGPDCWCVEPGSPRRLW
jgi:hypothetical protein